MFIEPIENDRPGRILIVEDDEELTFVLRAHMSAIGYIVETRRDAESAIDFVDEYKPDVIVMDYGLPGMSGVDAIRQIMSKPENATIGIIMVTAHSQSDLVVMAMEAGAQEYVVKPFEVSSLLARVRTVFKLRLTRLALDELNQKLANEVQEQTSRLQTLYNFTRMLNLARSQDEILDLTIRTVKEVTGSQRVSILLKEENGSYLRCARATGMDESIVPNIRVSKRDGIAGKVFSTGRTYVATASNDIDGNGHYESESFISTPLVATSLMTSDETLGVLSITDKPGGDPFTAEEVECIRSIADSGAIALHNQMHREKLDESVNVLLMTVGRLAEFRDNETGMHLERVREYARLLAQELQRDSAYSDEISDAFINNIYRAAPMHDIGKVGVADYVLCKPGKLTDEEYAAMKEHCRIGRDVMESAVTKTGPVPILTMCVEIAGSHHERFDGRGYPDGIGGTEIPLAARIIALVDAYDAITSKRRYKGAKSHEQACDIIREDAGKHFDPEIVATFDRIADQFDYIRAEHEDGEVEMPEPVAMLTR